MFPGFPFVSQFQEFVKGTALGRIAQAQGFAELGKDYNLLSAASWLSASLHMHSVSLFSYLKDPAAEAVRTPPHSRDSEQAVLGGLMLSNTAWDWIADQLDERDFYSKDHRVIFRAIRALAEESRPFDHITVAEWLEARHALDEAGGMAYLYYLARETPSAANVRAYAEIVRERAIRRDLIRIATEIADLAYDAQGRNSQELLNEAEKRVFAITERGARGRGGFVNIKDLLTRTVERVDLLFQSDSPVTGLPTGWVDFDRMTTGLQPGELIIVAGRPSMGKTAFAMNIAEYAAIQMKRPVAVFSMEMPGESLIMRLLSSLGRIEQQRVRSGRLDDEDWVRLTSAVSILSGTRLFIDDSSNLSPHELRARARRLHRQEGGLGLIVIDYLQLMQVPGTTENRATEISEISRSLKALARELAVPVIALSQLNRTLETRNDKRPIMSDLRESGAIEQDADLICFLYRDEVYNPESTEKGVAEIIIGKQRNGPTGKFKLTFLGQFTRFEGYVAESYSASTGTGHESSHHNPPRSGGIAAQSATSKSGSPRVSNSSRG